MIPISAVGYPNYFSIDYTVQEGAKLAFSIDEVRIIYHGSSSCGAVKVYSNP